jgi:hypothetical protein
MSTVLLKGKSMKVRMFLVGLLMALCATHAFARSSVPIVNFDNVGIVTSSGKKLDNEQVRQVITKAAAVHEWTIKPIGDNKVLAVVDVRGKHTATVEITWTPEAFNIHYKSSVNLNYEEKAFGSPAQYRSERSNVEAGPAADRPLVPAIHPHYNKWVETLKQDISKEFLAQ